MDEKALKITALGLFLLAVIFTGASYKNLSNRNLKLFTEWDEPTYVITTPCVIQNVVEPMFPLTKEEIQNLERHQPSKAIVSVTSRRKNPSIRFRRKKTPKKRVVRISKEKSLKKHEARQLRSKTRSPRTENPEARKLYEEAIKALNEGRVLDASAKLSYIVSRYPGTKEAYLSSQLLKGEIPTYKEAKARRLFIEAQHALGEDNKLKAVYLLNKAYEDYPETKYGKLALSLLKKLYPE